MYFRIEYMYHARIPIVVLLYIKNIDMALIHLLVSDNFQRIRAWIYVHAA